MTGRTMNVFSQADERAELKQPAAATGAWIQEIRGFEPVEPDRMFVELFAGMYRAMAHHAQNAHRSPLPWPDSALFEH